MGANSSTSTSPIPDDSVDYDPNNVLRIVLVGKTGSGKSATGNSILGDDPRSGTGSGKIATGNTITEDVPKLEDKRFVSEISCDSVTKKCERIILNRKKEEKEDLVLVDTPGLFDTKESLETTCNEISRCVILSSPGPHAIILVLQLGRFTEEDQQTVSRIKALFGSSIKNYLIVLFTRKDDLEDQTLERFLEGSSKNLRMLLKDCEGRCCAFNNKAQGTEREAQVEKLLDIIEKMRQANEGGYFSEAIYQKTEEVLQKRRENLKAIYTQDFENNIHEVEEQYSEITNPTDEDKAQKECKIRELEAKHEENMKKVRVEAEQGTNVLRIVAEYIRKLIFNWFQ